MRCLLTTLLLCAALLSVAQKSVITGVVTDNSTGEALPFTHVFLNGTTIVSVTDESGQFFLRDVPAGSYQLVASFVGYQSYSYNLTVNKPEIKLNLRMVPLAVDLQDVVVAAREDKEWNRRLKQFKKYFLGETRFARQCEIVNPWVIDFEKRGEELQARAQQPIELVNNALGYRLHFYLQKFVATPVDYSIVGPVRFTRLTEGNEAEWAAGRLAAFQGSQKHFLQSLYKNALTSDGFKIYVPVNALEEEQRSNSFSIDLGKRIKEGKLQDLVRDQPNGTKGLIAHLPVEIHFERGQDHEPVYRDVLHQVSWIQSKTGMVRFDSDGNITNPQDVIVVGYWNRLRVADMLPLDYKPGGEVEVQPSLPEKLQIITDREWYNPGDLVWYSVIVSGESKKGVGLAVHVALTDSTNRVLGRRLDPVDSRRTSGFVKLPARPGVYFISAFTASSYARGEVYMKPLMSIAQGQEVVCQPAATADAGEFTASLTTEGTNGVATLGVTLRDLDEDVLNGNFVVSIASTPNACDCLKDRMVTFQAPAEVNIDEGVARGRVVNKKGKPVTGRLVLFTDNLSMSMEQAVDGDGKFELTDLVSYDSSSWMAQLLDEKNKPVSDFQVVWDKSSQPPAIPALAWKVNCAVAVASKVRRMTAADVASAGLKLPDSVMMLSEITVRSRKMSETPTNAFRSFGHPQYVLKGEEFANNPVGTNLVQALNGRFPGLRINESMTSWTGNATSANVRGNSTLQLPGKRVVSEAPLVIVDGMTFDNFEQAMDLLQAIPLTDIEKVEVRNGLSPIQGLKGTNGVITVYTKRTGDYMRYQSSSAGPNPFVKKVVIQGYSTPGVFGPKDAGSLTLHWNPQALFVNGQPYRIVVGNTPPKEVYVTVAGFSPAGDLISVRQRVNIP